MARKPAPPEYESLKNPVDQAFGAARAFIDNLDMVGRFASHSLPTPGNPDAWKEARLFYAFAFIAWFDLTHWLTPEIRNSARRAYPAGAPPITLGRMKPMPTVIEAVADELGIYFRNAVYVGRCHPLEPDFMCLFEEAEARLVKASQGKPIDGFAKIALAAELKAKETRAVIRARRGIKTYWDGVELMMNEWLKLGRVQGESVLRVLQCGSVDFELLRVQLDREAQAVISATAKPPLSDTSQYRDAAWISKATAGGLDAGRLAKMVTRGTLKDVKTEGKGKRRLFRVEEVANKRSAYAQMLMDALEELADFRKPRERERRSKTKTDKGGQGRTKPDT